MFEFRLSTCVLAALYFSSVLGHTKVRSPADDGGQLVASETAAVTNPQSVQTQTAPPVPLVTVALEKVTIKTNTSHAASSPIGKNIELADAVSSVDSTALVIARDSVSAYTAYSSLNDHGIPYLLLIVPINGTALPSLNDTADTGNFGLIVVLSEVSYDYGGTLGYQSALTTDQWDEVFSYQLSFGVRMVRLDVYPSTDSGTVALGDCCDDGVEQLISSKLSDTWPHRSDCVDSKN